MDGDTGAPVSQGLKFLLSGFALMGEVLFAKSLPGLRPLGHPSDVPIRSRRIGFACPRESTQREGHPQPLSDYGLRPNPTYILARPAGPGLSSPFRRRRQASQGKPGQARPCLSASSGERDRELGERRFCREAQGTRAAGKPPGHLSFGYFSLVAKEKYLAVKAKPVGLDSRQRGNDAMVVLRVRLYIS